MFAQGAAQKAHKSKQIDSLKAQITFLVDNQSTFAVGAQSNFAVDAAYGTSDMELKVGLAEVDKIIDYAAEHEDVATVVKQHEFEKAERAEDLNTFAVDAADGTSDIQVKAALEEVEKIIKYEAEHEDLEKVRKQHELEEAERVEDLKIFAVMPPMEPRISNPQHALKKSTKLLIIRLTRTSLK